MNNVESARVQASTTEKRLDGPSENNERSNTKCYPSATSVDVPILALRGTIDMTEEDVKLRQRLIRAMTMAQENQDRGCGNLIVLTDKLHDWARDLDEQENWLRCERHRLVEQQQAVTVTHLEVATACIKDLSDKCDSPVRRGRAPKLYDSDVIQQYERVIGVLEGNIEVLIPELQIEKETREAAEEKLRTTEDAVNPVWPVTRAL